MLHFKLQIGCIVIVLLISMLYFRERRQQKNMKRMKCFERLLVFSFVMLKIGKTKIYVYSAFGVVFLFMILAVICLGWEFGFQQYCIGFVASIIFTDFYINRKKKITKKNVPPDITALKMLAEQTETPLEYMTDEELEEEKKRLLNILADYKTKQ